MKNKMMEQPEQPGEAPEEYEVKDAADTLMKAEDIKNNKHLMKHVHKHLKKKQKQITSIAQLRALKNTPKEPGEGTPAEEKMDADEGEVD